MEIIEGEHSAFQDNAVFFIGVDKITPNPFQPRREFNIASLNELANSIRMYGILQPLVVTRMEVIKEDGGLTTSYELIAGERRLRASKIAGLREVPVLIRSKQDDEKTKLELAIIENLQREDLNPIDRSRAFFQLADKFKFTHQQIAKKIGKSREYVSNSIRILSLPEEILEAVASRKISEGHARSLLMLVNHPEEQNVLYREIVLKKLTVRDTEKISRQIAQERVRKADRFSLNPEIMKMEESVSQKLGARVHIEPKNEGGRIRIEYMSKEELHQIVAVINESRQGQNSESKSETEIPNEEPTPAPEPEDSYSLDNFSI